MVECCIEIILTKNMPQKTSPIDETTIKTCSVPISVREEEGEFYSEGFIATTHVDRAYEDGFEGTALSKESLQQIVDYINSGIATTKGVGSTRTVSLRHDWVKEQNPDIEPAGMAVPPAEIRQTGDGHWGVWCKTHHNKHHGDYDKIVYDVKHGYLPGYSIEFNEGETEPINVMGKTIKLIKSLSNFVGYAFASARLIANPKAVISGFGYREMVEAMQVEEKSEEVKKMTEEEKAPEVLDEVVEEKEETTEEEAVEDDAPVEEDAPETKEVRVDLKEVVTRIKESPEFKEALDGLKVKSKVIKTGVKEESEMNISIKELNESLERQDVFSFREYVKPIRDKLLEPFDPRVGGTKMASGTTIAIEQGDLKVRCDGKGMRIVGKIQQRGILDTGSNTSSYTQQPVEFADVFAPGIIDTFNNLTNLFGFLRKEAHVGGTHYQWKMVTNRDPDSNATFVDRDDTSVMKNFANKHNFQTPLKVARRGVSVTDFSLRYSAASLGDLFQIEVDLQMKELMKDANIAIFAEVADGTGNSPLGLEAVADSAGNTTLYGYTRSTANRLAPAAAGNTYTSVSGALTEAAMRAAVTYMELEGTRLQDVAIIASPKTRDYLFNLLDGSRRFNTTDATFGFSKMKVPSYDGIPVIVDPDCNADGMYFVDTDADVIVMGMEPRIVSLAKVGAATEAYIEMHFAHVYKQPRRIHMLDALSGP